MLIIDTLQNHLALSTGELTNNLILLRNESPEQLTQTVFFLLENKDFA